jgi:hypothetical protein
VVFLVIPYLSIMMIPIIPSLAVMSGEFMYYQNEMCIVFLENTTIVIVIP